MIYSNCCVKAVDDNFRISYRMEYIILDSIVVSIPACHAEDRGSIPHLGDFHNFNLNLTLAFVKIKDKFDSV